MGMKEECDDGHVYHRIGGQTAGDVISSRRHEPRQSSHCVIVTVVMATVALCVAVGGAGAMFFHQQRQQAEVDLLKSTMQEEVDLLRSTMQEEVDLLSYRLQRLHADVDAMKSSTQAEVLKMSDLRKMEQQSDENALAEEMEILKGKVQDVNEINQMSHGVNETLDRLNHTMTGWVQCQSEDFYNGQTGYRFNYVKVKFSLPYHSPPAVFVSVMLIQGLNAGDDLWFDTSAHAVTTTGFSVQCGASGKSQIRYLWVNWISIAK